MSEEQVSRVFAALADPVRRAIVARLFRGEATVSELAEPFEISLQAVSKHLNVLESAGLITRGRDAQRRPCRLNPEVLEMPGLWLEQFRMRKDEQFQRLDAVLQEQSTEESS